MLLPLSNYGKWELCHLLFKLKEIIPEDSIFQIQISSVKTSNPKSYMINIKVCCRGDIFMGPTEIFLYSLFSFSVQLMVIVEFCQYGSLHKYLLRHRDDFIDQLDRTTGKLNLALGMGEYSRSQSTKNKTK
jgi:hypothetical protein